jgi:hypothetical protein
MEKYLKCVIKRLKVRFISLKSCNFSCAYPQPFYRSVTPIVFVKGKNEFWPIPKSAIDAQGKNILTQNPGY